MGVNKKYIKYTRVGKIYDNCSSDEESEEKTYPPNKPMLKTASVACTFDNGLIMGTVAKTMPEKIFQMDNGNIVCGFGTAACDELCANEIENERIRIFDSIEMPAKIGTTNRMFKKMLKENSQQLTQSAILIGGGIRRADNGSRPVLYRITARNSRKQPYAAVGIRSFAPMRIFDEKWHNDLKEAGAIQLVREALDSIQFPRQSLGEMEILSMD